MIGTKPLPMLIVPVLFLLGPPPVETQEVVLEEVSTEYQDLRVVQVAGGLEQPWAVAFLPDGRYLVTERPGRLNLVSDGSVTPVSGLPEIHVQRQGGLLDVGVHPDYEDNGWIYLTYSKAAGDGTVTALARARLEGTSLVDLEELFQANTPAPPGGHYGSRVVFLNDGTLLMTVGDRAGTPERAQDTRDHSGSVLRITEDGGVPTDNPFVGREDYAPEIFTYGHRNIQGLAWNPTNGEIWATEHGPRGGDELNLLRAGENYGWPDVSMGRNYGDQEAWGEERSSPTHQGPVFEFLPTLAPSGLAWVEGGTFHPTWEGNLLAGGLRAERILRLVIEDGEVVHAEELLAGDLGRIRDLRQGPDGLIYVLTGENSGGLYRIEPSG